MVKQEDSNKFINDVMELYGFMMAQEIAISPLTPKDTTRMARSFPATYKFIAKDQVLRFTTPFYTKFVHEGTRYMAARPFIVQVFHQKSKGILKKAFRIVNKKYK